MGPSYILKTSAAHLFRTIIILFRRNRVTSKPLNFSGLSTLRRHTTHPAEALKLNRLPCCRLDLLSWPSCWKENAHAELMPGRRVVSIFYKHTPPIT